MTARNLVVDDSYNNNEALLKSVDPSALCGLCETHSLTSHDTKVTAFVLPDNVAPNADGKCIMTIYSMSDRNNLMSVTSGPGITDFLLDSTNQTKQSE